MKHLLGVILLLAIPVLTVSQSCTNGRVFNSCGTSCPRTCQNIDNPPAFCTFQCVARCFCPTGLVELGEGCVAPEDCPNRVSTQPPPSPPTTRVQTIPPLRTTQPPPTPTCTNGRVYKECGTACPLTCQNPLPRPCIRICVRGCFCPNGMIQNGQSCVSSVSSCPGVTTELPTRVVPTTIQAVSPTSSRPTCTNGMSYTTCGTACPLTCQNRFDPPRPCPAICVAGCSCPSGMALYQGACYAPENCPVSPSPTPSACTNGMVYRECGTACPLTCQDPFPRPCPLVCVRGCFCPDGMIQNGDSCVSSTSSCPGITPEVSTPTTTTTQVVSSPSTPTCTNGMVYQTCGTACPLTCNNHQNPPLVCTLQCVQGCFCPQGMVRHNDRCVAPRDCPTVGTTTETPTPPTRPTCSHGMMFTSCGVACPTTCENYGRPIACTRQCFIGCVCPPNTVLHNGGCIPPIDCPRVITAGPTSAVVTTPVCPTGMEYRECGPVCRDTCPILEFNGCFSLRCAPGCFCPQGQYEYQGRCVASCPTEPTSTRPPFTRPPGTRLPTGPPRTRPPGTRPPFTRPPYVTRLPTGPPQTRPPVTDLCAVVRCAQHTYCQINSTTGRAACVPDCQRDNGGCPQDQLCEVASYCRRRGRDSTECEEYTFYPKCKAAPFVFCGQDAFLACDSEWTYCLQQNKTRRATCVASCFARNGNCGDNVCITTVNDNRPTVKCLPPNNLPSDCPAGQVMNQCGNRCQRTCDAVVSGEVQVCPLVCGPPACACPSGLVLFRDRCVDPRLCYTLMTNPPAAKPLPVVDRNTVFLALDTVGMTPNTFTRSHRDDFISSVQRSISRNGYPSANVTLHSLHQDNQGLQIVIKIFGNGVSKNSIDHLASVLRQNSNTFTITVQQVAPVDVDYVNGQGLSTNDIIIIAVCSVVVGIMFIVLWIVVVACCCCRRGKRRTPVSPPPYNEEKPIQFSEFKSPDGVSVQTEKGKLIMESLYH